MELSQVLSAALGLGLAGANVALSLTVLKGAMRLPGGRFMKRVLLSLAVRMLALLVLLVLILAFIPLDAAAFGGAFVVGVVAGILLEMWIVLRWSRKTV